MKDNDYNSSALKRWMNKKVEFSKIMYDGTSDNITCNCEYEISDEIVYYNKSLKIKANTDVEDKQVRPTCKFTINFDETNLNDYNRYKAYIYISSVGHKNFYVHFPFGNNDDLVLHTQSIVPNRWNEVTFEISRIARDKVKKASVEVFLFGTLPEAIGDISIYFGGLVFEKVKDEYELGFELEDRISYCHLGYLVGREKIAICEDNDECSDFYLYDSNDKLVYQNKIEKVNCEIGKFMIMDFSSFDQVGLYYLTNTLTKTALFEISNDCYKEAIDKTLNFYYSLRCGEEVKGIHSACHLNCRSVKSDGTSVPNFGGWHDAGDLSQFEICTAEMAHALLDLAKNSNDESLKNKILEEAKVGVVWLLRTRFNDGYRALAVSYSIWRNNMLKPDNTDVYKSKAENGPFENFCSAACLIEAYRQYKQIDEDFANWCKRAAIEDFYFAEKGYKEGIYTKRWGPSITSQTSGEGCFVAGLLYEILKEEKYLIIAKEYANDIMTCQEVNEIYPNSNINGFFYEDTEHKYILSYEHRGHEQCPIIGLTKLCEVAKSDIDYSKWLKAINLYANYIKLTSKLAYPYNILPAGIYNISKVNIDHFTVPGNYAEKKLGKNALRNDVLNEALFELQNQIRNGKEIGNDYYLRIFPIAIQRRGFFATLLSKTKAVSIIAKLLDDEELMQIAINQIEWILGKNPFSSCTMYGVGHNYHPLYVAFSRQIEGALPVGIKTYKDYDLPYWPTINNAVYKEIWGHTSGKFIWVLADILEKRK